MPALHEDDEVVATSQGAATALKTILEETKTGVDEEEEEPASTFMPAQARPTLPLATRLSTPRTILMCRVLLKRPTATATLVST